VLVDVVEDQVERAGGRSQRLHRLGDVVLDDVLEAERAQMAARLARQLLVPNDVMHRPATILLHRPAEPGGRVAVPEPSSKTRRAPIIRAT
jgi:hypothetical protein